MNNYELVLELRELELKQSEVRNKLREFLRQKMETERTFQDGEIVCCYNGMGLYECDGIIEGVKLLASLGPIEVSSYAKDENKYQREISTFLYGVKQIKKDGTKSSRNVRFNALPCEKNIYGWYIQKKQTP